MSIFNKITKTFQWGDKTVIMETGEIALEGESHALSTDPRVQHTYLGGGNDE